MQRVFDGHNDVLLRLWRHGRLRRPALSRRRRRGPPRPAARPRRRARGGFFAVYVPGELGTPGGEQDDGVVVDFPHIGPVDASDARRITLEMAGILLRMAREQPRRPPRLPDRRGDRGGRGRGGRDGRGLPPRGRRGDRPRPRRARGALRRGPALARAGLVAAERLRRRHPLPLPRRPGRRPGPHRPPERSWCAACNRLGILVRPLASERRRLPRRGGALRQAARRHPLERARRGAALAQPDRRPARHHRREPRCRRPQLRRRLPARRRPPGRRHRARRCWSATSTTCSPTSARRAWRSAPTSTAR